MHRKPNGRWEVRWREGSRRRGWTFDRKRDAVNLIAYQRRRQQPAEVEEIRGKLSRLRDRTLVSALAYSGARPEEVVCRLTWGDVGERTIRYVDTKRRRTRVWQSEPERPRQDRNTPKPARTGCARAGTRPRDLRSSFITLRVYEGIPLTQIAREVGTSVRMIELHYAGVIANWDGRQVPAVDQIKKARQAVGRGMDVGSRRGRTQQNPKPLQNT